MDSAFIHQAANELVQNAGTRNIKQIARSCSLDISETSRIKDMLGLLSLYFDKPLILINRQLDKQTKQMVCGYALGHYLEHQLLMDLHTIAINRPYRIHVWLYVKAIIIIIAITIADNDTMSFTSYMFFSFPTSFKAFL